MKTLHLWHLNIYKNICFHDHQLIITCHFKIFSNFHKYLNGRSTPNIVRKKNVEPFKGRRTHSAFFTLPPNPTSSGTLQTELKLSSVLITHYNMAAKYGTGFALNLSETALIKGSFRRNLLPSDSFPVTW